MYQKLLIIKIIFFGHIFFCLSVSFYVKCYLYLLPYIIKMNMRKTRHKKIYILLVPLQSVSKKVYEILNKFIAGKKLIIKNEAFKKNIQNYMDKINKKINKCVFFCFHFFFLVWFPIMIIRSFPIINLFHISYTFLDTDCKK